MTVNRIRRAMVQAVRPVDNENYLSWLAGRPPKAGNAALNQPITKWDVLGQPDPEGTRHRSSTPSRFARMHFDIDPAPFKSTAQAEGSTWCPSSWSPMNPDSPRGPDGPVGLVVQAL